MQHHDAFHDDGPPISQLQAAVRALEEYVHVVVPSEAINAAPDPSPSRRRRLSLSPIQRFAQQEIIGSRWKELGKAHMAVCGLSGVGATTAEALVRAGVGGVFLVDHERNHMSCMGRMVYQPDEVGFSRTQALRLRLQSATTATPSVESMAADLTNESDLLELRKRLKVSSIGAAGGMAQRGPDGTGSGLGLFEALTQKKPYDAVLSCVEDDGARLALNQICLELSLPLLQVSLSPCNTKIFLRSVLPGNTCCFECMSRAGKVVEINEQLTEAPPQLLPLHNPVDEVDKSIATAAPASLPHVELMAGGLLAQHAIKFLLEIGDFVPFFTMNTLEFEIESYSFPPNRQCSNMTCRQRQDEDQNVYPTSPRHAVGVVTPSTR